MYSSGFYYMRQVKTGRVYAYSPNYEEAYLFLSEETGNPLDYHCMFKLTINKDSSTYDANAYLVAIQTMNERRCHSPSHVTASPPPYANLVLYALGQ